MKYKLKCLLHDKISFGNVGQNKVCIECDCFNMIYCQNEKQIAVQQLIEQRIKCRREIKQIEQQKYILNLQSQRLEYQYQFEEEETINLKPSIKSNQQSHLDNQLQQIQNNQKIQNISKYYDLNNQLLLDEFENLCTQELEEISNAEFIIYHMNNRKKWSTKHPMQIEQALSQKIIYSLGNYEHQCRVVGNKIIENQPLEGYYIVYIYSIFMGDIGRMVNQSMENQHTLRTLGIINHTVHNSQQIRVKCFKLVVIFNQLLDYFTFYHSMEDHNRYVDTHIQLLQAVQCNNPNHHHHHKCSHSHHHH